MHDLQLGRSKQPYGRCTNNTSSCVRQHTTVHATLVAKCSGKECDDSKRGASCWCSGEPHLTASESVTRIAATARSHAGARLKTGSITAAETRCLKHAFKSPVGRRAGSRHVLPQALPAGAATLYYVSGAAPSIKVNDRLTRVQLQLPKLPKVPFGF